MPGWNHFVRNIRLLTEFLIPIIVLPRISACLIAVYCKPVNDKRENECFRYDKFEH